jgi:hypothetical protein
MRSQSLSRRTLIVRAGLACAGGTMFGCSAIPQSNARSDKKTGPRTPTIASGWFRIIDDPYHHLNDFCLFKDQKNRWHAMGIMGTGTWASEQSLFHWSGDRLDAPFTEHPPILTMMPPPQPGEKPLPPQKHAPFVIWHDGLYHLFYRRPKGTTLCVRSSRPDHWPDLGEIIFADRDARDVCIVKLDGTFWMYYCQLFTVDGINRSCILARRSDDLRRWSEPMVVHADLAEEASHSYLESPYVVARPEGYYLFIRHRRLNERVTTVVLFSRRPDQFPSGERVWFYELDFIHAPEIVEDGGRYWIARVSGARHANPHSPPSGGWVDVAELAFT